MTDERWLPAVGFDGYEVSNRGYVKRVVPMKRARPPGVLKRHVNRYGYYYVKIGNRTVLVHRLVCTTFIGPAPTEAHEVNHKDLNRLNPAAENLEWMTRGENMRHAFANGATILRGEEKPHHKLTAADVAEIKQSADTQRELGKRFGVCHGVIGQIKRGEKWRSTPDHVGPLARTATGSCDRCGVTIYGRRSHQKYCSPDCERAARTERLRKSRQAARREADGAS